MQISNVIETHVNRSEKLRVFVLQTDSSALIHQEWLKLQLETLAHNGLEYVLEGTEVSSTGAGPFTEDILRTARESDVIVIASTELSHRDPALVDWLNQLMSIRGSKQPDLLMGLFGDEKEQRRELDWLVRHLVAFTRGMKMDFVWKWMESEGLTDNEWLIANLEQSCANRVCMKNYQLANSIW